MRSAILTTLFAASALTTAAPPSTPPSAYMDTYPGGSILLVSNMTGQRPTEFRYPININKVTVVDPPSSAINNITEVKFFYFLNVEEAKVECHAYLDEAGLKPFRKSQFDGCISSMYAATTCTESGLYSEFYRCRECFGREYADSFSVVAPPKITEKGSPKANDMELAEQLMKLTKEVIDQKTHAIQKGCPMNAAS